MKATMRPLFSAVSSNPGQLPHSYTNTPAGMQPTPYQQQQAVQTAAGTRISISATQPVTFDEAGYTDSGVVFVPLGEVTDAGSHGKTYVDITHKPIATRATQHFKGSFDQGTKTVQMGLDQDDAGQDIARQAVDSDASYSFKFEYPNGDADYFSALVSSFVKGVTGVDTIITATMNLLLTSGPNGEGIVEVLASS